MNFPLRSVRGVIARRLLLNFRVRPDVLADLLPESFRPKLLGGTGMAGICLIRLEKVRPLGLPGFIGVASENAAHRIAVEWTEGGKTREGVYIPRRDTDLFLNRALGGRLFPGWSHPAGFEVEDDGHSWIKKWLAPRTTPSSRKAKVSRSTSPRPTTRTCSG